jgi:hypothetical protein
MSLNGTLTSLGSVDLRVTRTAQGTRQHGRYTPGPATTFSITCGTPEPVTGRELKDMPEGRRGDEILKLFASGELVAEKPGVDPDTVAYTGSDPDMLTIMGAAEEWTVIKVDTWTGFGETHREVSIARAPSPAGQVP